MSQIQSFSRLSAILTMDNTQFLRGTEVASKKLAAFSAKATTLGANITRSLGVGLALVGTAAVKTAADYNRATATLGAIVGKNTQAFKELNEQSRELGRTSIFTATQVAEAQLEISKLGFQADRTKAIIKSATDIAAIFGGSIEDVGKTIASTLNQFGLEAEESGDVADIMAVAFRDSALDISKFREAMKNVGPTAKATGLDLKKTTALLAVLANNAVDGSLGGTKLRSTLSDLAKQFPDAASGLKKLENGTLSYAELVELLNKRAALVGAIFQDQGDAIEEMEQKLDSATGTTTELAKAIEGELFANVERLKAATESLGISIGNALAPMVADLADAMEEFAQAVDETDPKTIEAIANALILIVKFGAISLITGQLAGLANGMATFANVTVPNFAASLANLTGVFGALKIGGGLIGAIMLAGNEVEKFFARMDEGGDKIIADYEERVRNAAKAHAELTKSMFEFLTVSEQYEGQRLANRLGVENPEEIKRDLAAVNDLLTEQYAKQERLRDIIDDENAKGADGDRERRNKAIRNNQFLSARITESLEQQRDLERLLDLIANNNENAPSPDPIEPEELGSGITKALSKVTFDNDRFLQQLLKDIDTEIGHVFGQNFMFDELSLPDQLIALMNGQPIMTSSEFDNQLFKLGQEIEALEDDFEDIFDDEDPAITKLADTFINIREGLKGATQVAMGFADVVGQAFLTATEGATGFGEALKNGFLSAFKAIIAKLITLITLYAILAVLSGGASMKGGGSFGAGVGEFVKGNNFGDFIKGGLSVGRSSSVGGGGGGTRSFGLTVGGSLMGGDIAFASASGRSANDRRFL